MRGGLAAGCILTLTCAAADGAAARQDPEAPLGSPTPWRIEDVAETLSVADGTPLRSRPDRRSAVVERVAGDSTLVVLERRAGWARVDYGGRLGWLLVAPEAPDLGAPGPTPEGRRADALRLDRLRLRLPEASAERRLGPYPLLTDVGDEDLLAELGALAAQLRGAYGARYGLDPGPPQVAAVALFAREADYRAWARDELLELDSEPRGEIGHRIDSSDCCEVLVAATYVGDSSLRELRQILVHQLTHLLNRRALGPDLPLWIDEGLAEDLGYGEITATGRLRPERFGGSADDLRARRPRGERGRSALRMSGPHASLFDLLDGWRGEERVPFERLLGPTPADLGEGGISDLVRAECGFLVRYLLDGRDSRRAERFRAHLRTLAAGGSATADPSLEAVLGLPPRALETRLYAWAVWLADANGVPVPR